MDLRYWSCRSMTIPAHSDELISFWFSEPISKRWFNSTPDFDNELRERYAELYAQAAQGQLDAWQASAHGALALVILLDQIPLNIFRGLAQSFATEAQARDVADCAIGRGFDQQLGDTQKAFLYMPFMHSEDLADQERSVALYSAAGLDSNLRFARHHRELIRRFGRFPHRNAILGRVSTAEEIAYLNSKEAFHG